MRLGEIRERADVNYAAASRLMAELYAKPLFPLTRLGDCVKYLQYGISALATEEPVGVPILRMNNLQDDGWDLSSLKYIQLSAKDLDAYRLEPGDILFNRTNSKELVGKCEVFREEGDWVFASYLIRVSLVQTKAIPEFVSAFLGTLAGRVQIDRVSRQIIGMSNVNAEEIRALLIPLPPLDIQRTLVAELEAARAVRQQKLAQADELLAGLDGYLLEQLGLTPPEEHIRQAYAVRVGQIRGKRLDPPAYRPFYRSQSYGTPTKLLGEVADVGPNKVAKPTSEDTLVPYVGLPECELTYVREVAMRPYSEVKGRSIVRPGDILFARIEPSVFNKKYVLVDDLKGHEYAYTSTEFYVLRAKESTIEQDFLYAMFFCSFVFVQVRGKTTGSSGRRRISLDLFATLQIPVPDRATQKVISAEVERRRAAARRLREKAITQWEAAKSHFEQKLISGEA